MHPFHRCESMFSSCGAVVSDGHAFYIDYHYRNVGYVEKVVDHIDWDDVNSRFRKQADAI